MRIKQAIVMLKQLLPSNENWAPAFIRITLAIVLFPHGAQKLVGWFGGPGFSGAIEHLTVDFGLPWVLSFLVIFVEFFAPLFLLVGLFTRISACSVFILFVGIIFTAHATDGFFMNWFGQLPAGSEGFEYHLLILGMSAALITSGGGKYAADIYMYYRYAKK